MASLDSSNQSYSTLMNQFYAFFKQGNWNYLYDRLAGSKSYLLNPANASGIIYAYQILGAPSGSIGNSYYGDLLFYYTAYYGNLYPLPAQVQSNCAEINSIVLELQTEIQNSDKLFSTNADATQHSARTSALTTLISQYNSMYVSLSCDAYLVSQSEQSTASAQQAALDASQKSAISTFQQTSSAAGSGSQIAIYVAVGVAVLIGFMALKKMN